MIKTKREYDYADVLKTLCARGHSWWGTLILEPLTLKPTLLIAKYTRIKPNHITILSLIFNVFSAVCFFQGTYLSLILGAFLFELSFILDYMDGTLARLTNSVTELGRKLDFFGGCLYSNLALVALLTSQGMLKNDVTLFLLGLIYIILNDVGHFGFLSAHAPNDPLSVSHGRYVKSKPLTFLITKYLVLKNFFKRFRLSVFPTEIDTLNVILFLAPLFGFLFWGILFGLITISIQFTMVVLINLDRKTKHCKCSENLSVRKCL